VRANPPGESQRFPFLGRRPSFRHDAEPLGKRAGPGPPRLHHEIALLHQHSTEDRANLEAAVPQAIEIGDDDAHVRFAGEDRPCVGLDARHDHGLDERRRDGFRRRAIDRPVERNDPAEGGPGISVAGAHVRLDARPADRGAARIRVLDHRSRGLVELEHDAHCRVEIEQVRIRQLLALQDRGVGKAGRFSNPAKAGSHV
jgi:hypothetical protein